MTNKLVKNPALSFNISFNAFKVEDSVFGNISLLQAFVDRPPHWFGGGTERHFMKLLSSQLNGVSRKGYLWSAKSIKDILEITLETTHNVVSMDEFKEVVESTIIPLLKRLNLHFRKLSFDDSYKPFNFVESEKIHCVEC